MITHIAILVFKSNYKDKDVNYQQAVVLHFGL